MDLDRDFSEFIESCVAHEVRFLIVGGFAVAAHGHPRFTKDLDLWVWIDRRNAERLIAALDDFGFRSLGLTPADFMEENSVVQLGYPPKRIDILTGVDGLEFDPCWERHVELKLGDHVVPFLSVEDLIANKVAAGRPEDLADVSVLGKVRGRADREDPPMASGR